MMIWEIKVNLWGMGIHRYTLRFAYQPVANDIIIALALVEDRMEPGPQRELLREIRYGIPADLEINPNGTTEQTPITIVSTPRFVLTKVDTEVEGRVQNLPGEGQPESPEGLPTILHCDGVCESVVPPTSACHDESGGRPAGSPRDNCVCHAVVESDLQR